MSYQPKIYRDNNGDDLTVASGGILDIESGGAFKIAGTQVTASAAELNASAGLTASGAELNLLDDAPATITFAAAAGGANVCEVTVTVKDAAGVAIDAVHHLDLWLSDAATGAGLTGTAASGTVQAKAASGTDIAVLTAKKAIRIQTLATGIYILEITDTGKTGYYVCAANPMTGKAHISTQLVTGDYGT